MPNRPVECIRLKDICRPTQNPICYRHRGIAGFARHEKDGEPLTPAQSLHRARGWVWWSNTFQRTAAVSLTISANVLCHQSTTTGQEMPNSLPSGNKAIFHFRATPFKGRTAGQWGREEEADFKERFGKDTECKFGITTSYMMFFFFQIWTLVIINYLITD